MLVCALIVARKSLKTCFLPSWPTYYNNLQINPSILFIHDSTNKKNLFKKLKKFTTKTTCVAPVPNVKHQLAKNRNDQVQQDKPMASRQRHTQKLTFKSLIITLSHIPMTKRSNIKLRNLLTVGKVYITLMTTGQEKLSF